MAEKNFRLATLYRKLLAVRLEILIYLMTIKVVSHISILSYKQQAF